MEILIQLVLAAMAVFMILLVLVQRGRGGGLAGALGGAGGSSAFGAKAGDTFTRITVVAATVWIITCVLCAYWANHRGDAFSNGDADVIAPEVLDDAATGAATVGAAATGEAATDETPASE